MMNVFVLYYWKYLPYVKKMNKKNSYVFKVSVIVVLRSPSDAPWPVDVDRQPGIAVRVEKVGLTAETLSL